MELTHKQIFERYVYAGAVTRDPAAVAALFTEDGVYEAPLESMRLAGREAIRDGVAVLQRDAAPSGTVDAERSGYQLHETADPDVFIAEIDAVLLVADESRVTMSLVQIFRIRDSQIALLRDYFAPIGTASTAAAPERGRP